MPITINDELTLAAAIAKAGPDDRVIHRLEKGSNGWSGVHHLRCVGVHTVSLPVRWYVADEPLDAIALAAESRYSGSCFLVRVVGVTAQC